MRHLPKICIWRICILVLTLIFVVGLGTAQAGKGGKKGSAGGKGYVDTGSAEYVYNDDILNGGALLSDGGGPYCHGVDGQVTLLARFIQDLDVHNQHDRTLTVDPDCIDVDYDCFEPLEVNFLGTYRKAYPDGTPFGEGDQMGERELVLRDMDMGDNRIWRATMSFDLGKKRFLLFGHRGFVCTSMHCGYPDDGTAPAGAVITQSEPIWVRCDAVGEDNRCVDWTISTFDLTLSDPFADDSPVHGCLAYSWLKGSPKLVNPDVEANFFIDVRYVEKGATCPQ